MKFWDSSAVVPLLAQEPQSGKLAALVSADPEVLVWWGTGVEVISALTRREREGVLSADAVSAALVNLRRFETGWEEVVPSDALRETAERVLRNHPLRAADSLQLAAALTVADNNPHGVEFVCLDERLCAAARREGFVVVDLN